MKEYDTWNFTNKTFLFALLLSLLWHVFWFFFVRITVTSDKKFAHGRPNVVSLGPVLDDTIFRTLAETKPRYTETFYRRSSDFSSPVEVPPQMMPRYSAGEVVSVPLSRRAWDAVRDLLGGDKSAPDYFGHSDVQGEAKARGILNKPPKPIFPFGVDASLKFSTTELEFLIDSQGTVFEVQVTNSSGNADVDQVWVRYIEAWQFSPMPLAAGTREQKGKIQMRFDGDKK